MTKIVEIDFKMLKGVCFVRGFVTLDKQVLSTFLSFSIYCLALAFEHYRQVYVVHSGLQDESLQVTISKLP